MLGLSSKQLPTLGKLTNVDDKNIQTSNWITVYMFKSKTIRQHDANSSFTWDHKVQLQKKCLENNNQDCKTKREIQKKRKRKPNT